jgi:selenocysteine-specific elongation factor
MRRLILGTAGHIDHGKTALVKALTGVDTDRLKEEKERGITVDLGFAEFSPREDLRFGVVDVPGHEGFIRNMLAGATGMDLVLLVVAADEGVMPQTREHLAIISLLGVPSLVVALAKADLVEEEWAELVSEEVRELLESTPFREAPILPTSAETGIGLQELAELLAVLGEEAEEKGAEDRVRLPLDRVFTIKGAGTVVTGTLWSGTLGVGDRVMIEPGSQEGRVRSLQVHGVEEREARPGARVAVGLSGPKLSHHDLWRGQTLVGGEGWESSWMLTARISVLEGLGWDLDQGQRVRVHLGTAEVLARAALLGQEVIRGGEAGWVQLRLEEPLLARVGDHLVVRTYSPVTTLGGGRLAEVLPRKRKRMGRTEEKLLSDRLEAQPEEKILSLLETVRWHGVSPEVLPQRTGLSTETLEGATEVIVSDGRCRLADNRLFASSVWEEGERNLLEALGGFHEREPLRPGLSLEELRQVVPGPAGPQLAGALLESLHGRGLLKTQRGLVSLEAFRPVLSPEQVALRESLGRTLREAGLSPPTLKELTSGGGGKDVQGLLRLMEEDGEVLPVDGQMFFCREAVTEAGLAVVAAFGGRSGLGPSDFREVLPLTRKHLLPLLRYFDTVGITTRLDEDRSVVPSLPPGWGTSRAEEK